MNQPKPELIRQCPVPVKHYIKQLQEALEGHRNAERTWEMLMMRLVGEDGPADVEKAINKLKNDLQFKTDCLLDAISARDAFSNLVKSLTSEPLKADGIRSAVVRNRQPESLSDAESEVQSYVLSCESLIEFLLNHIEKLDALDLRNKKSQLDQLAMAAFPVAHEQVQELTLAQMKEMLGLKPDFFHITREQVRRAVAITAYMMAEAMQAESRKRQGGAV